MDQPTILLTTFNDASVLARNGGFVLPDGTVLSITKDNLYSIALADPFGENAQYVLCPDDKIKAFCPTYDMLLQYKKDKDFKAYKASYQALLESRLDDIEEWIDNLNDLIYILCSWDNTHEKTTTYCSYRQLVFDLLSNYDKLNVYYRHGTESQRLYRSNAARSERVVNGEHIVENRPIYYRQTNFNFFEVSLVEADNSPDGRVTRFRVEDAVPFEMYGIDENQLDAATQEEILATGLFTTMFAADIHVSNSNSRTTPEDSFSALDALDADEEIEHLYNENTLWHEHNNEGNTGNNDNDNDNENTYTS